MASDGNTVVEVHDLCKHYALGRTDVHALRGVSLSVTCGTFVSITGPSGSGKSTLLSCIAGLERPTSGGVSVSGVELSRLGDDELTVFRRHRIGVIFQFFNLLPDLSVEDNVSVPLLLDGHPLKEVRSRVSAALASLGIDHRARHRPAELSGGEMQRAAIARALVVEPDLLLADEPTGNLDSASGLIVLDELRRARDERGQTVVLVTHDPQAAARGDRIVHLRDGQVVS